MRPSVLAAAMGLLIACPPAIAANPGQTAPAPAPGALRDAVDAVASRAATMPVAGMTIGVSVDGKPVLIRGYGVADLERGTAASAQTVYEIGSITKQFTAAAVLRLAEQGKLEVDAPVTRYFPALEGRADAVTLRHLLNHTSGLFSRPAVADLTAATTPASTLDAVATHDVEFAPGTRYRYNNNGYQLLGLVVEQVAGKPWDAYLQDEFLTPLGLRNTAVCTDADTPQRARAYRHDTRGDAPPTPHERHHATVGWAAGALCSTAGDMLAWQQALVSGKVVSPASYAQMTAPPVLQSGKPSPYGMGLFRGVAGDAPYIHHGGASSGFLTQLAHYPASGIGVVVLTNGAYAGSLVEVIEQSVARAAHGAPEAPTTDLAIADDAEARYAGTYDLGPLKIRVYRHGTHLRAEPDGQAAGRLLYQGDDVFVAEHDPAVSIRFDIQDGRATALAMSRNGKSMPPARRME